MGSDSKPKLPLIYFTKENLNPDTSSWLSTANKVRRALEDYGCFVAKYEEVTLELRHEMLDAIKDAFDISVDIKARNAIDNPEFWFRRTDTSRPTLEGFNFRNTTTLEGIKSFVDVMWPDGNDAFCDTFLSYSKMVLKLEQAVEKMVFESYGIGKYFDSHVESMSYQMGSLKYGATHNSALGFKPHTDKSFITILDSNHVKGLEIQTKDGKDWIFHEPAPGHFMVMAADACLAWSNGRIHSPTHRVNYSGDEDRYTIKLDSYVLGLVTVPTELVDDEHPLLFKPFSNFGFLQYCKGPGINDICPLKTYSGV